MIDLRYVTYKNAKEAFAPTGDQDEDAQRLAGYSKWFFGDPNNIGHNWIRNKIPKFHLRVYKGLSSNPKFFYITAFRESGKSTIIQLVYITYQIAYQLDKHILLLEKIDPEAVSVLRKIKRELSSNRKWIKVFGDVRPSRKQRLLDGYMWSRHEIKTTTGIYIRSIGMGGNARGGLEDEYRFTLILGNDMQSIKHMKEPQTLKNHIDFWERDVEPAIDSEYGKVRAIGNMLGPGCLMESIVGDKKYKGIDLAALIDRDGNADINGRSAWEDRFPTAQLRAQKEYYEERGKLHVFLAEWMNIITEQQKLNFAGYRYYNGEVKHRYGQNVLTTDIFPGYEIPVHTYRWIDPAYGNVESNDPRAAVTAALGMFPGKAWNGEEIWIPGIWVLDYKYDHSNPALLINEAINDHPQYHYRGIVIEANGPQRIYQYLGIAQLQQSEYVFKNPVNFVCVTKQTEEKYSRIYNELQPKCSMGQFFIKPEHTELKSELELFRANPRGIHILDAIQLGLTRSEVCRDKLKKFDDRAYIKMKAQRKLIEAQSSYNNPLSIFEQIGMR
jgi:hypothetical protein